MSRTDLRNDPSSGAALALWVAAGLMAASGAWAWAGRGATEIAALLLAGAVAAGFVARQAGRRRAGPPDEEVDQRLRAETDALEARFTALLDATPDPILVVSAREPDDLGGLKIERSNAAARTLFRPAAPSVLLVSVLRDPEVLSAVDEALFGGVEARTAMAAG